MAISVRVPKDLSGVKTKVTSNLTKGILGIQEEVLIMVGAKLSFFFLVKYEKDGFPAEDDRDGNQAV